MLQMSKQAALYSHGYYHRLQKLSLIYLLRLQAKSPEGGIGEEMVEEVLLLLLMALYSY